MILWGSFLFSQEEMESYKFIWGLYSDNNYNLAKNQAKIFINSYPQSKYVSQVNFILGNIYYNENDYKKAITYYSKINSPNLAVEKKLNIAKAKIQLQDYASSEKDLDFLIKNYPKNNFEWEFYYNKGLIYYYKNAFSQAKETFLISLEKNFVKQTESMLCLSYLNLQEDSSALKIVKKSLQYKDYYFGQNIVNYYTYCLKVKKYLNIVSLLYDNISPQHPNYENYLLSVGIAYYNLQNIKEAKKYLSKILENENAKFYLALIYIQEKNFSLAEKYLKELKKTKDLKLKSNSVFYLAKIQENINISNEILLNFIQENKKNIHLASIYYLLALNHFTLKNYDSVLVYLENSKNYPLSEDLKENLLFLKAENDFYKDNLISGYSNYIKIYPKGNYSKQAFFKIGSYYYNLNQNDSAIIYFDKSKLPKSKFFIAEAYSNAKNYDKAKKMYELSISNGINKNTANLRISQIYFEKNDYVNSLNNLEKISADSSVNYEKKMLQANNYFALKDYSKAILFYSEAQEATSFPKEIIKTKKALAKAYYNLKNYDKSKEIYEEILSLEENDSEYILELAKISFTKGEFQKSIDYFSKYLQDNKNSQIKDNINFSIANCYYNLKEYEKAAKDYIELLKNSPNYFKQSLDAFLWCSLLDENIAFDKSLESLIENNKDKEVEFLKRKIIYNKNKGKDNTLVYEKILTLQADKETLLAYANLLVEKKEYNKAEKYLIEYNYQDNELNFLHAKIKLAQKDTLKAIDLLGRINDKNEEIYLVYLDLIKHYENFLIAYKSFSQKSNSLESKEKANLFYIDYLCFNKKYESALKEILKIEKEAKDNFIKAKNQFFKAYILYSKKDYEKALPEFLKIKYLYADQEDILPEAYCYIVENYLKLNEKQKAKDFLEKEKKYFSKEQKAEFKKSLAK